LNSGEIYPSFPQDSMKTTLPLTLATHARDPGRAPSGADEQDSGRDDREGVTKPKEEQRDARLRLPGGS
jgi:hypothetical protein